MMPTPVTTPDRAPPSRGWCVHTFPAGARGSPRGWLTAVGGRHLHGDVEVTASEALG